MWVFLQAFTRYVPDLRGISRKENYKLFSVLGFSQDQYVGVFAGFYPTCPRFEGNKQKTTNYSPFQALAEINMWVFLQAFTRHVPDLRGLAENYTNYSPLQALAKINMWVFLQALPDMSLIYCRSVVGIHRDKYVSGQALPKIMFTASNSVNTCY